MIDVGYTVKYEMSNMVIGRLVRLLDEYYLASHFSNFTDDGCLGDTRLI